MFVSVLGSLCHIRRQSADQCSAAVYAIIVLQTASGEGFHAASEALEVH